MDRAKATHKPGSDIDPTLSGEAVSRQEEHRILEELEALDLPSIIALPVFGRLGRASLRDRIERGGGEFHARPGGG